MASQREYHFKKGNTVAVKTGKYRNRKCVYDSYEFDSQGERDRYIYLKYQEQQGEIDSLSLQVEVRCILNGVHCWSYWADFVYRKKGAPKLTMEDHKSDPKVITKEFKIKWRTLHAIYGMNHEMQIHYQDGSIVVLPNLEDIKGYVPRNKGEKDGTNFDFSTHLCSPRKEHKVIRWCRDTDKRRLRKLKGSNAKSVRIDEGQEVALNRGDSGDNAPGLGLHEETEGIKEPFHAREEA